MSNSKVLKKKFAVIPGAFLPPVVNLISAVFFLCMIFYCTYTNELDAFILCVCLLFILLGLGVFVYSIPFALCTIEIKEDRILCLMPFQNNIEIEYEKCFIGMDYHNQNGGQIWWIYFCYGKMPPYRNPHLGNRINSIKCQPGFIRIMYREDVYEALIESLPKKQQTALMSARRCAGFDK